MFFFSLITYVLLQLGHELEKMDADKSSSKYMCDLEKRLRISLEHHRERILRMSADISTSRQHFIAQLIEAICQADTMNSYNAEPAMRPSTFVKFASVDVQVESVHNILRSFADDERFVGFWAVVLKSSSSTGSLLEGAIAANPSFVTKTHVTMAHFLQMKQEILKATFEPLCGSRVKVKVLALLWSKRVAALAVVVASEGENGVRVPSPLNQFPHITIWYSSDASSKESNELPMQLESGESQRIDFEEPIDLPGVISLWKGSP